MVVVAVDAAFAGDGEVEESQIGRESHAVGDSGGDRFNAVEAEIGVHAPEGAGCAGDGRHHAAENASFGVGNDIVEAAVFGLGKLGDEFRGGVMAPFPDFSGGGEEEEFAGVEEYHAADLAEIELITFKGVEVAWEFAVDIAARDIDPVDGLFAGMPDHAFTDFALRVGVNFKIIHWEYPCLSRSGNGVSFRRRCRAVRRYG